MTKAKTVHPALDQALAVQRELPGRETMLRYYINADYNGGDEDGEMESLIHIDHYWGSHTAEVNFRMTLDEEEPIFQLLPEEVRAQVDMSVLIRLDIPVSELLALCRAIESTLPQRESTTIVS